MKRGENRKDEGVYIDSYLYKDSLDYYNLKFTDMPGVSWNWSAFVFGFSWFAYRKMYLYAFLFGLIDAFCSALTVIMPELTLFISAFMVVVNLVCGLFGNAFYYLRVKKLSAKISKLSKSEAKTFVRKKGGSSVPAVIIFALIMSSLTVFSDFIAELILSL